MNLPNLFKLFARKKLHKRRYEAAAHNRLTNDWATGILSADAELYRDLRILRSRSRELCINNDYARRFLKRTSTNVIGSNGILLNLRTSDQFGNFLKKADSHIMEQWNEWGKRGNCSTCGKLSWIDSQKLFLESVARDGEVIVRLVKAFGASGGEFGFAMQFIEADHLDEDLNQTLSDGNYIRMGIEFNKWNRPIAYHILANHPGDFFQGGQITQKYLRIPDNEIIHAFLIDRPSQSRGVPWMHSSMTRLRMLGGYEEAELVAARVSAAKMGFFTSPDGGSYIGTEDTQGNKIMEAEPGTFEQLPAGMDIKLFDPKHPTSSFADFEKSILRGIASGLDISYATLANDLENVNFSSIRHGSLEDRDTWRVLQTWVIEHFCNRIFEEWLLMGMTTGKVNLPITDFDRYNKPIWRARGWAWVDPLKESHANKIALSTCTKTRSQIAADQGMDIEEIYQQTAFEEKLAEQYGLKLENEGKENKQNKDQEKYNGDDETTDD